MRNWVLALGCALAACGDGCCGCGGCDCGPLEEWVADYSQERREETERELADVDPVAHAYLRTTPELVEFAGGSITAIDYDILVATPNVTSGTIRGEDAKRVGYMVTGPSGTKRVVLWLVHRAGVWTVVRADYGTTHLGELVSFDAPPPSPSGTSGGSSGGGGGFDWD